MNTLRLERFDANSNTSEVIGRFETNDIEYDAFRLDAFIMNRVDASTDITDIKVLDIDQVSEWLDNPDNSLLIIASSNTAIFVLRKDNNEDNVQSCPRGN